MTRDPSRKERSGCLLVTLGVLLSLPGAYWLVVGEIIIESKGVYATGASARIAAVIWIVVCLFPAWQAVLRVKKK